MLSQEKLTRVNQTAIDTLLKFEQKLCECLYLYKELVQWGWKNKMNEILGMLISLVTLGFKYMCFKYLKE